MAGDAVLGHPAGNRLPRVPHLRQRRLLGRLHKGFSGLPGIWHAALVGNGRSPPRPPPKPLPPLPPTAPHHVALRAVVSLSLPEPEGHGPGGGFGGGLPGGPALRGRARDHGARVDELPALRRPASRAPRVCRPRAEAPGLPPRRRGRDLLVPGPEPLLDPGGPPGARLPHPVPAHGVHHPAPGPLRRGRGLAHDARLRAGEGALCRPAHRARRLGGRHVTSAAGGPGEPLRGDTAPGDERRAVGLARGRSRA